MHRLAQERDVAVGLVLIGFGDPRRLQAIARHLGWTGRVLSDPQRALYRRLGVRRAPWWRVYNAGTLRLYLRAFRAGQPVAARSDEDTRQLGADAVLAGGRVVRLWLPRSPDDRPAAADVLAEAARVPPS